MIRDLRGKIAVRVKDNMDLEDLCVKYIPTFDKKRFEIVAVRVFAAGEFIVTIYAADKESNKDVGTKKYPVKKFKIETLSMSELFAFVDAFNFTVSNEEYEIEDMTVTNK
jgi:hypothetical protein